jgi:AcrR family transcriptional regulator
MSGTNVRGEASRHARKRRSDGERSRNAILREAAQLATVEGISGLSISRLAEAASRPLRLQGGAPARNDRDGQRPVHRAGDRACVGRAHGLERLRQLAENFLRHVEDRVFPGGCFFASVAAEMDTHPGPVRDRAVELTDEWFRQIETAVRDAQAEGAIDPAEGAGELAFELYAYMLLANAQFVASQEPTPINRARRVLERRLTAATPTAIAYSCRRLAHSAHASLGYRD